jgi:hypothetical protein
MLFLSIFINTEMEITLFFNFYWSHGHNTIKSITCQVTKWSQRGHTLTHVYTGEKQ